MGRPGPAFPRVWSFWGPGFSACAEFLIARSTRGREDQGRTFRLCGIFWGRLFRVCGLFEAKLSACAEFLIARSARGREVWGRFSACAEFSSPGFPLDRNFLGPSFPPVRNFRSAGFPACAEYFEPRFSACAELFGAELSARAEFRPYVEPQHGHTTRKLASGRSA